MISSKINIHIIFIILMLTPFVCNAYTDKDNKKKLNNIECLNCYNWQIVEGNKGGVKYFYTFSRPAIKTDTSINRNAPFIAIHPHISNNKDTQLVNFNKLEIQAVSGFLYDNQDTEITTEIRDREFNYYLFTHGYSSWTYNQHTDIQLINDLKKCQRFHITSHFSQTQKITDTFSCAGLTNALSRIDSMNKKLITSQKGDIDNNKKVK